MHHVGTSLIYGGAKCVKFYP